MQLNSIRNRRQQFCLVQARKRRRRNILVDILTADKYQLVLMSAVKIFLCSLLTCWFSFKNYNCQQNELRHFVLFWGFPDFKKGNVAFPLPFPRCNVVLLFELPLKNNKNSNFEWRGQGRRVDSFVLLSYPILVCLKNYVTDCSFKS